MSEIGFNNKRKKILEELDQGKEVSNMELGMYDLTPYFKTDDFDMNLYESIMINKNFSRKIEHINDELYFSPPQYRALACLYEKERVIISAPTSFGKTLLVKEYIFQKKPRNIVYIVPTNALAYELERSFKENPNFSQYVIFDKCSQIDRLKEKQKIDENLFFIGTQEKFLEIDFSIIGTIDLFVIDEAYKLQESVVNNQRAYKLSETFLDSLANNSKKVFLLTPKATLQGFEKYGFHIFNSSFNAVEKNYSILEKDNFFSTLLTKGLDEKTLLFCRTPNQINDTYEEISSLLTSEEITDFVRQLETDIHPDWSVVKLLKAKILTHHGQMPKYVQNRMINLFNENECYNILFGTNSISEGINTSTKNLFIHPDSTNSIDTLLLKNTVGRAGRLGKYPIGHIFSTSKIENVVEDEIIISLAISDEEELSEIEDSKNTDKITSFSESYDINFDFCQEVIKSHKISLNKLGKILDVLKEDRNFPNFTNLPFMASKAFSREYSGVPKTDAVLMQGYLQFNYFKNGQKNFLNDYNDRIAFFKYKTDFKWSNTSIINAYMQFIYSTLEYYIMPIVNIGLELYEQKRDWVFGKNVIESLEACKSRYYTKTYGNLDIDNLSENQRLVISAMKDYGMTSSLKSLNTEILDEIVDQLNIRYSTTDVIRAINYLANSHSKNRSFFIDLRRKYLI
ncbi:MAG: DEAD/DEAH box helicase [Clostridia bacterium]|nr:DEAD/DEAH box helicase [Clostridia bacterium]